MPPEIGVTHDYEEEPERPELFTIEGVTEAVGGLACDYADDCPVTTCRTDRHHLFQKRKGGTLAGEYRALPEHIVEGICRRKHRDFEAEHGWAEYPDRATMKKKVDENRGKL